MSNCLFQGERNVSLLLAPGSPASAPSVPLLFPWCVCGIRMVSLCIVWISQIWREKGEIIPLAAIVHHDFRGYNEGQTAWLSSSIYQHQDAPRMVHVYSQLYGLKAVILWKQHSCIHFNTDRQCRRTLHHFVVPFIAIDWRDHRQWLMLLRRI